MGFIFLIHSLPVVIFFSALVSLFITGELSSVLWELFLVATKVYEYIGCGRISYLWKYIYGYD